VTTSGESRGLRAFTIVVLATATVAMLALSMLTNATFGYRFGTTAVTAGVFAAANVIADIWKGLGLIIVAGLLRERHRSVAVLLAVLWVVALMFGVASSMGVYVQDRSAMVGGREAQQANLRDVERELASEEDKQRQGGVAGDAVQIEAAIEAIFAKPVMTGERLRGTVASLSARCTRVDARTTEDCHRIAELRTDLAAAAEKSRRELRLAQLRRQVRELRERGAGDAADPVAELFAWMSRGLLSVRDVGFGFPVAFALLIELVSAFGPLGIATYAAVTRTPVIGNAMASPATPTPLTQDIARIEDHSKGSVVDFVAEETEPAPEASATGSDELYDAYVRWCRQKGRGALPREPFGAEFDRLRELPALRGKIRKFGSRYFGIAVAREDRSERGRT
jgi:hypothetical protein